MAEFTNTKSLDYRDVHLLAKPGKVVSRSEVKNEGWRVVIAAMSSVVGQDLIRAVAELPEDLQPTIHIPRDTDYEQNLILAKELGLKHIFVGIGFNTPQIEDLALKLGFQTVLLDVASGYLPQIPEKVQSLKSKGFKVITGSVHTLDGGINLMRAGVDILRLGIAPGSQCITRMQTGFTRGTITEILALSELKDPQMKVLIPDLSKVEILADGGLRLPADYVKAFLAGADYCMGARLFADAAEAKLRVSGTDIYFGQASTLGKQTFNNNTPTKNVEGKATKLSRDNVKSLREIVENLWDGIRSGVSYSGYTSLTDAIGNGLFEIVHSHRD
jgi:hypothetical protein